MSAVEAYEFTDKLAEYNTLRGELLQDRSSFDAHFRELANYIKPRRTRFFTSDKNRGDKRNQNIMDSTATFCCETLKAGMQAGMSSPALPWIKITVEDQKLADSAPVKEWLQVVTDRVHTAIARSNMYSVLPTVYGDAGTFASAAMSIMEDDQDLFRCYSYPIGSFAVGMNARRKADTFLMDYTMTTRQIVTEFCKRGPDGKWDLSNVSTAVKDAWDKKQYHQTFDVSWVIGPNPEANPKRFGSKYLPFASCWFETNCTNHSKFLRESGFHEFPVMFLRWDATGEDTYGTDCPGMTTLPDIKQLQMGEKRGLQALEKMVNPPLQAPTSLQNKVVSLLPSALSFVDETATGKGIRPIHEVNFAIDKLEQKQQQKRNNIRQGWYTDLFLMLASSDRRDITAREVDERHEEKYLALGPVVEHHKDELLIPAFDRIYGIMDRAGLIPEPPEELIGMDLKIEPISMMAQAQKLITVAAHERFIQGVSATAAVAPDVLFKIDWDQEVDDYGEALGVNPNMIRPTKDAQAARAEVQKQQQQAHAAQMAESATASAKNLSQSDMTGQNALTQLVNGVRGI